MADYVLYHWGVKGQKWGVRRYQKKNGSLTPAGKKRRREMSDDAKAVKDIRKKKVYEMSNAELRKLNERQQLENQHRGLNPSLVKKGLKFMASAAVVTGTVLTLHSNAGKLVSLGKTACDKFVDKHGADILLAALDRKLGPLG